MAPADAMMSQALPDALLPYKGRLTPRFFEAREQLLEFINKDVLPVRAEWRRQRAALEQKAAHPTLAPMPAMHWELREKAKKRGVFNFFLPEVCGLSCLEYAPIQELLGAVPEANFAMNCMAPDTGNMEVLEKFGTPEQKRQWLEPLLAGDIRSCFAMTEPGVASSDATNISTRIVADGNDYVISGHKWYISGAMRPECKVAILLGKTSDSGPMHRRHSMILVPMDAPGIKILRPLALFGHEHDHAEILFQNVRVPKTNLLLGEGRGFEIAQGRLGPGRIHHCMRTIGQAETALGAIVHRIRNRKAFGSVLASKDTILERIAEARMELTMCRQLCYLAAVIADEKGFKEARSYISMIKVAAPRMALKIIDEAIQIHGAHGLSQDCRLGDEYIHVRHVRLADGPDIVHLRTVAKEELKREPSPLAIEISGENKNVAKYGYFSKL
eukprot:TRINITY_DN461_c0_g1_i1.p1 TRINITY_DN461_c0_g1~~TRINITY_DN461_c0_g1_i1.p1  ORF type:complete len:443 (+),score=88.21 TRINITY_DN461_c0_g1_i1:77-1405(+)